MALTKERAHTVLRTVILLTKYYRSQKLGVVVIRAKLGMECPRDLLPLVAFSLSVRRLDEPTRFSDGKCSLGTYWHRLRNGFLKRDAIP